MHPMWPTCTFHNWLLHRVRPTTKSKSKIVNSGAIYQLPHPRIASSIYSPIYIWKLKGFLSDRKTYDQGTCADCLLQGLKRSWALPRGKASWGCAGLLLHSPLSPDQPGHPSIGSLYPSPLRDGDRPHLTHHFSSMMSSATPAASKQT